MQKNCLTSSETFNQWFRDTPGVNYVSEVNIIAYWDEPSKAYKFRGTPFFPLDGQGYGYEGLPHNYGFCYELHTQFSYMGGEQFEFMGDDDVWVFINNNLAIDLGGVHSAESDSVNLDTLGLQRGNIYPLDFFFCERHYSDSNLIFSTTIVLDPCGTADVDGDGTPDLCDYCPIGDPQLTVVMGDQIGPDNTVTFTISLNTVMSRDVSVTVDFGDEKGTDFFMSLDHTIVYSYKKSGDYTVLVNMEGADGCAASEYSLDISLGQRKAPKCSEMPVVPGTIEAKKKRSI